MGDSSSSNYSQIIKSTSIIGGSQIINMLLGMVRVKFSALLIGTVGVGLVANYGAIQNTISTVAGLGIQASGVRSVAESIGRDDQEAIGRIILTLCRICWVTGMLGVIAMAAFSSVLSRWSFGTENYALEVALLGLIILFSNIAGGQSALIQGMRRIADLARINITCAGLTSNGSFQAYRYLVFCEACACTQVCNDMAR
jgi:antigen flippase